jgi:hypothetical protein
VRELHVRLILGATLPGRPLELRARLIEAIERDVGPVGDTGTGFGAMDMWLSAKKPNHAARRIRAIANRLGIAEWIEVTIKRPTLCVEILADDDYPIERAQAAGDALIREIESGRLATVEGDSADDGIVTVYLELRDATAALAQIDAIARRLEIADRIRVDEP